ncbi:MAG: tartrate dehydratase [Paenibacillus macerans]|uniref:tartrate dehydratase n=1 Tax=Paenibacillus macerans TaxID=44252 RepID=UPI001F1115E1|nr:tartrate dehydratase [Paenibacillus macerans]MDU5945458.1 tartrate dehydratase [Paenibacillus macerans]MDU7473621.1 tartrate dehydratase [Paenibacillus macerans]MEC0139205.1 tartrate dehydratase [Paenibacillus macerans]UMV47286.1 tartrate dehydratase [Paenibacillus macerans]
MPTLDEVRAKIERRKVATLLVAKHVGKIMEGDAKQKASWEDRTGHTRQGIQGGADVRRNGDDRMAVVYLAHTMRSGLYLETGTGLYGPKKREIKPKHKKALRFPVGGGQYVIARSVKGMKPRPIIKPTVQRHVSTLRQAVRDVWRDS